MKKWVMLCKVCSLDSAALTLAMCSLFCCCLCKVCSLDSDALLHAFCNLSLAFMTDFTLSDKQLAIASQLWLVKYALFVA